jgi:hypothetical protein
MTTEQKLSAISKCCESPVTDHLSQVYPERTSDELRGKTNWNICTKCDMPCDLLPSTA